MRKNHHIHLPRLLTTGLFVAAFITQVIPAPQASAAQITNRKITLEAGPTDGGSKPGGIVNHKFDFTMVGGNVGSIKFEYCTTAAEVSGGLDCDTPTGLDTSLPAVVLGNESGATGFTGIDKSTNGTVIISRGAAAPASGAVSYRLDNVKNPTIETTFFVRISTHTSLNGTDATPLDTGTVTSATAEQIVLDGTMPESLVFCTGKEVLTTSGVPDCATATSGAISFNQLFSPTDTATSKSQMAASTNAGAGYAITVNGTTLTSGANTIAGMSGAGAGGSAANIRGVAQFGLNLKANTVAVSNPAIGTEISPVADAGAYRGRAAAGYDTVDYFKFASGNIVADSNSAGTDAQIYTISYIANVPGNQPAGTYSTTLTYICTPTF